MATKYIARFHGKIVGKRTTKDRTYTHAIVVAGTYNTYRQSYDLYPPAVVGWCGRPDLARKQIAQYREYYTLVEMVPAETA